MPAIRLIKRKRSIIAANAPPNTRKRLALSEITRPTTETIRITQLNHGRIRKGRAERGLIVPGRLAGDGESNTEVALEADVAGALFMLFFAAAAEGEDETARLVLRRGRDVEAGEGAFVMRCDDGGLAGGEGFVGVLLGDGQEELGREGAWWELAGWGNLGDGRAFIVCRRGQSEGKERCEDSEGLHLENRVDSILLL